MTTETQVKVSTILVVLGIDVENKPHASKFAAADRDIVLRAAGLMSYRVLEMSADDVGKLKAAIPDGKVFATGKRFVPFVRRELYDQLAAMLGSPAEVAVTPPPPPVVVSAAKTGAPTKPETKVADKKDAAVVIAPWSDLAVGNTVLARDDEYESWFEAVVVSITDDDTNVLRLRWRDYPEEGQFNMHRGRVGVMGPGAR